RAAARAGDRVHRRRTHRVLRLAGVLSVAGIRLRTANRLIEEGLAAEESNGGSAVRRDVRRALEAGGRPAARSGAGRAAVTPMRDVPVTRPLRFVHCRPFGARPLTRETD